MPNKVRCDVCGFNVNPDGHESRCRPAREPLSDAIRAAAWIGDAVHKLDVRMVAQCMNVPHVSCEAFLSAYVTNAAMREYMKIVEPGVEGSAERLGTVFESRYFGDFRIQYLRTVFPAVADRVLALWTPPILNDIGRDVDSHEGT